MAGKAIVRALESVLNFCGWECTKIVIYLLPIDARPLVSVVTILIVHLRYVEDHLPSISLSRMKIDS